MSIKIQDPISALTHLVAFIACIPIMSVLVTCSAIKATPYHVIGFAIFGASLLLSYGTSSIYHTVPVTVKARAILRKIDHMMIFVLIAGTYTPVCLVILNGAWGFALLSVIWTVAFSGIILKACVKNLNRFISTLIYVLMGWLSVIVIYPLIEATSIGAFVLLLLGGLTYTLGAVIYALKWPKLEFKFFGFHEIFHLFVIGGTVFHIIFMFAYVL